MPFGLKNARVTYQQLMNKIFVPFIEKSMEVYVDDMLVKSQCANDHVKDLRDCFYTLGQYWMKLNPAKYAFSMESRKFLGFMVNHQGIEVNRARRKPL